jgi:hypothetical protein
VRTPRVARIGTWQSVVRPRQLARSVQDGRSASEAHHVVVVREVDVELLVEREGARGRVERRIDARAEVDRVRRQPGDQFVDVALAVAQRWRSAGRAPELQEMLHDVRCRSPCRTASRRREHSTCPLERHGVKKSASPTRQASRSNLTHGRSSTRAAGREGVVERQTVLEHTAHA